MKKQHAATQKTGKAFEHVLTGSDAVDFDSITLKNDIMFSSVFRDPKNCRELLQRILDIRISELVISEDQKSIKTKPWNKGIRLDVYVKDTDGNVYDIEMQVLNQGDLPLRSRYYHSEMDSYQILTGKKYTQLKSSIVIFLCNFDPFGQDRSVYTFLSLCKEAPDIQLTDKRQTVFVNIKGKREGLSIELSNFLDYLETAEPTDDFTDHLNNNVKRLREDFEWRENYMTLEMKMEEQFEAGLQQGLQKGLNQGSDNKLKELIKKKLAKGKSLPQIADECEESIDTVRALIDQLDLEKM